jgi:hypothetical protein
MLYGPELPLVHYPCVHLQELREAQLSQLEAICWLAALLLLLCQQRQCMPARDVCTAFCVTFIGTSQATMTACIQGLSTCLNSEPR